MLDSVEAAQLALNTSVTDLISNGLDAALRSSDTTMQAVSNIGATTVVALAAAEGKVEGTLSDIQRVVTNIVPAQVSQAILDALAHISNQALVRTTASSAIVPLPSMIQASLNASLSTSLSDRVQLRASMSAARVDLQSNASAQLAAAVAREPSLAAVEASTLAWQTAASTTLYQTAVSAAAAAESRRADSACTAAISKAVNSVSPPTGLSSSDYTTCSNGGYVYFSSSGDYFICQGGRFVPFALRTSIFASSTIVTAQQGWLLASRTPLRAWNLCFRFAVHAVSCAVIFAQRHARRLELQHAAPELQLPRRVAEHPQDRSRAHLRRVRRRQSRLTEQLSLLQLGVAVPVRAGRDKCHD